MRSSVINRWQEGIMIQNRRLVSVLLVAICAVMLVSANSMGASKQSEGYWDA
jgi:hypothetical protein